ncbi:MAG: potassium channel family protein [Elainella sp.]
MASDDLIHLADNKYNRLLSVLFMLLVSLALPNSQSLLKAIGCSFCLIVLLSVVHLTKQNKWLARLYSLLIIVSLVLILFRFLGLFPIRSVRYSELVIDSLLFILIALPIVPIQKEVFSTRRVTADTIKGGISIYLLLGLAWAIFYNAIYGLNPDGFSGISLEYQADLLHFSFVTLTTVGYGNITPLGPVARIAADLEAITGVMYSSILLARLVSLYNTPSQEAP